MIFKSFIPPHNHIVREKTIRRRQCMSELTYRIELPFSVSQIWEMLNTVEKWVPLLDGYVSHEILNETEAIWTFKSGIGVMKKKISVKVNIVEWNEPTKLTLHVTGINEKFSGYGYIETKPDGEIKSVVTIFHNITVKGTLKLMTGTLTKAPNHKKRRKIAEDVTKKLIKVEKLIKESEVSL